MIVTANNKLNTFFKKNTILVIDDVNSANKTEVFDIIDSCNYYINNKLSIPTDKDEIMNNEGPVSEHLAKAINYLFNRLRIKKSMMFTSETQLNNFKVKVAHWYNNDFSTIVEKLNKHMNAKIVIKNKVSKHERLFLRLIADCGATILVIDKDFDNSDVDRELAEFNDGVKSSLQVVKFNTNENIEYTSEKEVTQVNRSVKTTVSQVPSIEISRYKTLDEIEQALYKDNKTVKISVSGVNSYIDTCNFYAKLNKNCMSNSDWLLANGGFSKPTYEQISAIPRISDTRLENIALVILNFLTIGDKETAREVKDIINDMVRHLDKNKITPSILYNRVAYVVCSLNTIYKAGKITHIVYYGRASKNDLIILDVLAKIKNLSLVVICPDKSIAPKVNGIQYLEIGSSVEIFQLPVIDKRDSITTMAAQAAKRVEQTFFNGDTLGMYKPGQFISCKTVNFNTTFDEIELWWNKDIYLRPGFQANGTVAVVPTIFRVIKGCYDNVLEYYRMIQKFCCGKTLLCRDLIELGSLEQSGVFCNIHRGTDVMNTRFEAQRPFFENGKIVKDRIKNGVNYKYGFLDINKQDLILDKIEEVLNGNKVNKDKFESEQEFIDTVLNIGLSLDNRILQMIQWFEFYTYNPNLVLTLTEQTAPSAKNMILLALLQSLGFDILIFVPTGYTTIESLVGQEFVYETNIIGECNYNIDDMTSVHVTNNIEIKGLETEKKEKKHGFFSKLFGM